MLAKGTRGWDPEGRLCQNTCALSLHSAGMRDSPKVDLTGFSASADGNRASGVPKRGLVLVYSSILWPWQIQQVHCCWLIGRYRLPVLWWPLDLDIEDPESIYRVHPFFRSNPPVADHFHLEWAV